MKTVLAAVFIYHRHNVRFFYSEQGIPARLSVPFWRLQCVRILMFKRFTLKTHLLVHLKKKKSYLLAYERIAVENHIKLLNKNVGNQSCQSNGWRRDETLIETLAIVRGIVALYTCLVLEKDVLYTHLLRQLVSFCSCLILEDFHWRIVVSVGWA